MVLGSERLTGQLRRGVLEYCVLAMLERERQYAFDLVGKLARTEGMEVSEGTIYPLLSRLRKEGRVSTSWEESEAGPPRRYYDLTDEGRLALSKFTLEWSEFKDLVDGIIQRKDQ